MLAKLKLGIFLNVMPTTQLQQKEVHAHFSTLAMDGVENNLREGRKREGGCQSSWHQHKGNQVSEIR